MPFPFSLFPFFFVFPFPFAIARFPFPFRFAVFRLFLVSPSSLVFRFPALLGGGFCYFVSVLHSPCTACAPASLRITLVCCLIYFLELLIFSFLFFFSPLPILRFRFGRRLFHPVLFLRVLFMLLSPRGFCCDIKPVFLPVDIQRTPCPCRFFLVER